MLTHNCIINIRVLYNYFVIPTALSIAAASNESIAGQFSNNSSVGSANYSITVSASIRSESWITILAVQVLVANSSRSIISSGFNSSLVFNF